jgi:CBS domain-containing protein
MKMTARSEANISVRNYMARHPQVLGLNDTLDLAEDIMTMGRIRHLPVLNEGELVGIVSQRDMFRSAAATALGFTVDTQEALIKTIRIKKVMTENVVTISPDETVKEAARVMIDKKIGCLPVVEGRKLVGIITETDILRYVLEH